MTGLELLRDLGRCAADRRGEFVLAHPPLLSPRVQRSLRATVERLPPDEQERLTPLIDVLDASTKGIKARGYPLGFGPLEQLWDRVASGEINLEKGKELAASAATVELLELEYVTSLSRAALRTAIHTPNWREAIGRQRLLLAAVEKTTGPDAEAMQWEAGLDWIEICHFALVQVADGRLYREALRIGMSLLERAKRGKARDRQAQLLFRLGALHLDPYTINRLGVYKVAIHRWRESAEEELGEEFRKLPASERRMPEPEEAWRLADRYLRQALKLGRGDTHYRALKALMQTLEWESRLFKGRDRRRELVSLGRKALSVLEPARYPHQRAAVMAMMARNGGRIGARMMDELLRPSFDERVDRVGPLLAVDLVRSATAAVAAQDPGRALAFLRDAKQLFLRHGSEGDRLFLRQYELVLLGRSRGRSAKRPHAAQGLAAAAAALTERARAEKWDPATLGAELVRLALPTEKMQDEPGALQALQELERRAPLLAADYADALKWLRAVLQKGVGVNEYHAKRWRQAIAAYGESLRSYLELDFRDASMDVLGLIDDVAGYGKADIGVAVIGALAPLALRLQADLGDPASRFIQRLCKRTLAALAAETFNPDTAFSLLQVAKGLRFSTTLYAGLASGWRDSQEEAERLERIREAEAATDGGPIALPGEADEETVLTSYVRESERRGGEGARERLLNLRRSYDQHLNQRLLGTTTGAEALFLRLRDVQSALDEHTVLANFYVGASKSEEQVTVYVMLITRENLHVGGGLHPSFDGILEVDQGVRTLFMSPLAPQVQELRRQVTAEPGQNAVSDRAAQMLADDFQLFFGALADRLTELHEAGKNHLCVVPHGPLHYYPFQLLGTAGRVLADDWIVTSLPSLHLLVARGGQRTVKRYRERTLSSVGLSFERINPFGLDVMRDSLTEAEEVAKTYGVTAVLEEAATKEAFFAALDQSRFVHLSTHGEHDVDAPAFQRLYLAPHNGSDGRVFAHDILSRDLRGVELLTLSACETALGRFDVDDNLRGMPASFFQAGVSTIVGTLWPAEVSASKVFFTALYRELKGGATRLDAFGTAQRETRASFPQYRDWGAFHLMGDWDRPAV